MAYLKNDKEISEPATASVSEKKSYPMKYDPLDQSLYIKNRGKFIAWMKPKSVAILNSNDVMPTSADGEMAFVQHTDILYLSGIDQEQSRLMLFPDCHDPKHREILFIRETNEHVAIWEGFKLTKEQAREISGVQTIYWIHEFERVLREYIFEAEHIYLNANEHYRSVSPVQTQDDRFREWCKASYPLHRYERISPILHLIRPIKEPQEIEAIKKAIKITEKGFRRILGFVKPGVYEYEVEAEFHHEFLRNRSKGPAYSMIIASGANACVLHYVDNNRICKPGDVLLMDVGAEYANYASDMTRSVPVSGRFTQRQRQVYDAVRRVMRESSDMLRPGTNLKEYEVEVGKVMQSELIGLGLIDKTDVKNQNPDKPLFKKYFPHGTSHHMGLNVHDYCVKQATFEKGMVFTSEPGIYIREEGLGIRLENNLLVTDGAPIDLMADIPLEADEIESLMNA